ncbi:MAG: hypothetical protein KDC38_13660, partial [Planctomycetes bacterium]|nr:hypothetical protein [Planctomycetota bacterium]
MNRGVVLLPVLALLIVLVAVVVAALESERAGRRWRAEEQRTRAIETAVRWGLVALETELRRRLVDDVDLGSAAREVAVDRWLEVGCGTRARVRGRIDFPDADRAVPYRTVTRGGDGRIASVWRPAYFQSEIGVERLQEIVGSSDSDTSPETRRWLAHRLCELRDLRTWDQLQSTLVQRAESEPPLPRERLRSELPAIIRQLDPNPRLRRTNSHPWRTAGPDRGREEGHGAVLLPGLSGRFEFGVTVTIDGDPRPSVERTRRARLLERRRLSTESDWLRSEALQPDGVEIDGAQLGPERIDDATPRFGAEVPVADTSAATSTVAWTPWGGLFDTSGARRWVGAGISSEWAIEGDVGPVLGLRPFVGSRWVEERPNGLVVVAARGGLEIARVVDGGRGWGTILDRIWTCEGSGRVRWTDGDGVTCAEVVLPGPVLHTFPSRQPPGVVVRTATRWWRVDPEGAVRDLGALDPVEDGERYASDLRSGVWSLGDGGRLLRHRSAPGTPPTMELRL